MGNSIERNIKHVHYVIIFHIFLRAKVQFYSSLHYIVLALFPFSILDKR